MKFILFIHFYEERQRADERQRAEERQQREVTGTSVNL